MTPTPRSDVIKLLCNSALDAMEQVPVDNLTVGEVASAAYSLALHMTEILIEMSTPNELSHNRDVMLTALGEIYEKLDQGLTKN